MARKRDHPERQLAAGILYQTLKDVARRKTMGAEKLARRSGYATVEEDIAAFLYSDWFRELCDHVDVEPDDFLAALQEVEEGNYVRKRKSQDEESVEGSCSPVALW